MATLRFLTPLGAEVQVPVEGETLQGLAQAVLETQRMLGALGWRGATPPAGGFRLPLANEPDFDWRLLGAVRGRWTVEGEEREGVWYGGHFYTRREFEPNPRMKLGAAVKYSRGARQGDPSEVVEEGDGSFRYVTLAVFRGEGRRREEYAIPAPAREPESATATTAPATNGTRSLRKAKAPA